MYFTDVLNIKSLLTIPSQLFPTSSRQCRITTTANFFLSLLPRIYGLINITDYGNTFFNPNQAAVQAQMVVLRMAPYLIRIIFIMGSPAFIQPFHFSDSLIIMLMYDKVTHKNLIDSSLLFRNIKENLLFL